jgi:glycosyltransferase involved in cell wall biosynthesis
MAFIPYFVLGPTALMGLIGLLHGPDRTKPTPADDWKMASLDLLIPTFNEEKTIILCLASIRRQTIQPRQIFIYDDASNDRTIQFAQYYATLNQLKLNIIKRPHNAGKTPSIHFALHESDADVLAVVDGDTVLKSHTYLERLVQELYQGVGIASACGFVLPLTEQDRRIAIDKDNLGALATLHSEIQFSPDEHWYQKFERSITNAYREELYLFLQYLI